MMINSSGTKSIDYSGFDTDLLRHALFGLQSILKNLLHELQHRSDGHGESQWRQPTARRKISAAGRQRMADAQKKRWALFHAEQNAAARQKKTR